MKKHYEQDNENIYSTTDLSIAATLAVWFPIESLTKLDLKKVAFNFTNALELQNVLALYWRNELKVEPKALLNSLKTIKLRLHQEQL
jgi:hypothetical protein